MVYNKQYNFWNPIVNKDVV